MQKLGRKRRKTTIIIINKSKKKSHPATAVNVTEPSKINKKKNIIRNQNWLDKITHDLSQIKYYNYYKIDYYAIKFTEPKN